MKTQRPASVTAIAWVSIVMAGLAILSSAMGLLAFHLMRWIAGRWPPVPAGTPWAAQSMWGTSPHFEALAVLQILFAGFVLAAGLEFLRLRAWARTALEVAYWLALIWTVGFGVRWAVSLVSMTSAFPAGGGPPFSPQFFKVFGVIVGAAATAFGVVPCAVIIWLLRGPTVRRAMVGRRGPDLPPAGASTEGQARGSQR
jgi:hypothetical protein